MADLTLRGQYEEALRLTHMGEPREAIAVCRRILQTFPKHIGTYSVLGQASLALGDYEGAADLFRRVLSADPEHAPSHASLAAIHEQQGAYEEARWFLERAFELSPTDPQLRGRLRQLYTKCNLPSARIKMTRAALARTYLRGQLYPKAIHELRELVAAEPLRLDLRVALVEALWHDGHYEEDAAACQGILAELPHCLKANLILGQIWLNTEQDERARTLLQMAQSLDPDNAVAQSLFGARSALPPRTARLPLREEDAPEVSLPYLVDDEDVVTEGFIIEGRSLPPPMTGDVADIAKSELAGPATESEVGPLGEVAPSPAKPTAPESPPPTQASWETSTAATPSQGAAPKGLSLIDVQRQYVQDHPHDYQARLDLARLLRESGAFDQALEEYGYLLREDYGTLPEVTRDLDLLGRRHPHLVGLSELLRIAREKAFLKPPSP